MAAKTLLNAATALKWETGLGGKRIYILTQWSCISLAALASVALIFSLVTTHAPYFLASIGCIVTSLLASHTIKQLLPKKEFEHSVRGLKAMPAKLLPITQKIEEKNQDLRKTAYQLKEVHLASKKTTGELEKIVGSVRALNKETCTHIEEAKKSTLLLREIKQEYQDQIDSLNKALSHLETLNKDRAQLVPLKEEARADLKQLFDEVLDLKVHLDKTQITQKETATQIEILNADIPHILQEWGKCLSEKKGQLATFHQEVENLKNTTKNLQGFNFPDLLTKIQNEREALAKTQDQLQEMKLALETRLTQLVAILYFTHGKQIFIQNAPLFQVAKNSVKSFKMNN